MIDEQPLVSIDVVPFRYTSEAGLEFATGERIFEPFLGVQALPGVLLHSGESIDQGVARALAVKTGLPLGVTFHVGAFDSTNRDPRGATISIALASVQSIYDSSEKATWSSVEDYLYGDVKPLPFDHNAILKAAYERLTHELWNDISVTKALLGESFTTADALAVKPPTPHPSNTVRWLKTWGPLEKSENVKSTRGAGRPATTWSWK